MITPIRQKHLFNVNSVTLKLIHATLGLMDPPIIQHNLCAKVNDLLDAHGSPCFHQLAGNVAENWCITLSKGSPISREDL